MQVVGCPHCGKQLQLSPQLAGQQALCLHCGRAVLMPHAAQGATPIPSAMPGPPPVARSASSRRMSGCAIAIVAILATTCVFGGLGLAVLGSMAAVGYKRVQQSAMENMARAQVSTLESAVNTWVL